MKSSTCFCRLVSGIDTYAYFWRIKGENASLKFSRVPSDLCIRDVAMISIRESISDLEKRDQLRALVQDCYLSAIRNLAHYAIELEEGITAPYRSHMAALADEVET